MEHILCAAEGRLGSDARLQFTQTGQAVISASVAVADGQRTDTSVADTQWLRVSAPARAPSPQVLPGSAAPEQEGPLEHRWLRGRKLTVMLRSGERLEGCRLVSSDRYNFVFETVSDIASPTTSLVPKHAIDRIDVGERIAA
jgi:hypothetical protein